jgi:3-deoxy-manno-octulosonate cytidylyltransferase (CMP-KDO synthetase)
METHPLSTIDKMFLEKAKMKVIGVIPARYHSTRLLAKPLADIHGKPMVQHVYEIAQRAGELDHVVVATDDERIAAAVRGFGGQYAMTNPAHASGTDRVAEVAAGSDAAIVVNVQGDEPLLDPEMINECIHALKDALRHGDGVGLSTVVKRVGEEGYHDPSVVKLVRDLRGHALYFSRSLLPYPHNRPQNFNVFEHIGLYAYTRECLMQLSQLPPAPLEQIEGLEQLRALENGIAIQVIETKCEGELVSVDTQEDLERVRRILADRVRE